MWYIGHMADNEFRNLLRENAPRSWLRTFLVWVSADKSRIWFIMFLFAIVIVIAPHAFNNWQNDLLVAAEQGDAESQFSLGMMYYRGEEGLKQNKKKALEWFELAAHQNHVPAQFMLGVMYEDGEGGLERSVEDAAYWYKRAFIQGVIQDSFN